MRITENELRMIIRQVIVEQYELNESSMSDKIKSYGRNLALGGMIASQALGGGLPSTAHGQDLPDTRPNITMQSQDLKRAKEIEQNFYKNSSGGKSGYNQKDYDSYTKKIIDLAAGQGMTHKIIILPDSGENIEMFMFINVEPKLVEYNVKRGMDKQRAEQLAHKFCMKASKNLKTVYDLGK